MDGGVYIRQWQDQDGQLRRRGHIVHQSKALSLIGVKWRALSWWMGSAVSGCM